MLQLAFQLTYNASGGGGGLMCCAALTTFGYSRSEVLHQNVNIFIPTPFSENHQDHLMSMITLGKLVRARLRLGSR